MPDLTLVAGPNGSGKSTFSASIALEGITHVVDPDAIARQLDAEQPARAAISAARQAIVRSRSLIAARESFIVESTLAGHGAISLIHDAKRAGYRVLLAYVALGNQDLHIERVRLRASRGGHDIPDADIRRRYSRSLLRAPEAVRLADETLIFDNSGSELELAMRLRKGKITWQASSIPRWIQDLALRLE